MLAIIATHPIQYQVPLWQKLAQDGNVPFEVWYLSEHATRLSRDREFGTDFSWDIDMLAGYPHRLIETPRGATPNTPIKMRSTEPFRALFDAHKVSHVWVLGWQVLAYWQAVWAASSSGRKVWLRGESNIMAPTPVWKAVIKRPLLGRFFNRVDDFLCIGTANRDLYRSYGVPEEKLHMAPYAVDNERFALQAKKLEAGRSKIRQEWRIPEDAFVVLFCGKFILKKRPMDLIKAAQSLNSQPSALNLHLLFVGSGELGDEMRAKCDVVFDAERSPDNQQPITNNQKPRASFAGFLNQTEISKAYVAADALVLPSDYGETWGLVVNEANASGLPAIISDRCGCAPDLGAAVGNATYQCGEIRNLAHILAAGAKVSIRPTPPPVMARTASVVIHLLATSG